MSRLRKAQLRRVSPYHLRQIDQCPPRGWQRCGYCQEWIPNPVARRGPLPFVCRDCYGGNATWTVALDAGAVLADRRYHGDFADNFCQQIHALEERIP